MSIIARLKDGDLLLRGEINERLPVIRDGLIAHFPFDGKGGSFDIIGGRQLIQHPTGDTNLFESMALNWREPNSWFATSGTIANMSWDEGKQALRIQGVNYLWLSTPIIVDTNKHYRFSFDIMQENDEASGGNYTRLYAGGYGFTKEGVKYTTNYDYSMASGVNLPLGEWVNYTKERYGADSYSSGWTSTNGLCNKFHFGCLFNYYGSANSVVYIRNLRVIITDTDDSNCTVTNDGIAVEDATTNIVTNTDLKTGWSTGYLTDIKYNDIAPPVGISSNVISFIDANDQSGYLYCYGNYAPQVPNTTYTVSMWIKTLDSNFRIKFYTADNSETGRYSSEYIKVPNDGKWHKIIWNSFLNPGDSQSDSLSFHFYFGNPQGDLQRTWFCCPQMEAKAFATLSVEGSRGYPLCELDPDLINIQNGAIAINFYWDGEKYSSTDKWMMITHSTSRSVDHESDKINICYHNTLGLSTRFSNINDSFHPSGWLDADIPKGWNSYIVTWGNGEYKQCLNGDIKSYTTTKLPQNNPVNFYLGSWNGNLSSSTGLQANMQLRNFSIYDKYLTDEQIKKLTASNLQFTKNGDIKVNEVNENPSIPIGAYYYPLSNDIYDKNKRNSAVSEDNVVYENGGAWVGTATTNYGDVGDITPYTGYSTFFQTGNRITRETINTNGYLVMRATSLYPEQGKTIAVSGYMRINGVPTDYKASSNSKISTYAGYNTIYMHSNPLTGYFEAVVQVDADASNGWLFHSATNAKEIGDIVTIDNLQIEEKPFNVPYAFGTRGTSHLEFNLHESIGLNWNGDWTISYWKKPIGTSTDNLTGYSIESIGCNSNSVGGGYAWWGKRTGVNSINRGSDYVLNPNDYFNKWQFITLVKEGINLTWSFYLDNGEKASETFDVSGIPSANHYVNQYGYDLKLGGWDNTSVCNTYFKDLIVAPTRALSSTEIDEIRNTFMRDKQSSVTIQNKIIEGATL
ncbi:hypothetical protein [Vallitalea okinawensis]|uniref:hypothetical protein n=1 Tax=Vallitalea okinawensis TaxID=2078660 RepID=UPI000CFDC353|nr:hypothetical protein [Vallitalea okinawensis]